MPSPRDRVIRGDELEPGMLLKFRDGSYRRVVRRETVLAQPDGIKPMVPRLPELPPEAIVAVFCVIAPAAHTTVLSDR